MYERKKNAQKPKEIPVTTTTTTIEHLTNNKTTNFLVSIIAITIV